MIDSMSSMRLDPRKSPTYWIIATANILEQAYNREFEDLGMTFRQAEILLVLTLEGEMSQGEVARRIGIESPTIATIVRRMEQAGWITRSPSETDRRKKVLRPTDRVPPLWPQIVRRGRLIRRRFIKGVTREELRQTLRTLETIQANLRGDRSHERRAEHPLFEDDASGKDPDSAGTARPRPPKAIRLSPPSPSIGGERVAIDG